MGKIHKLSQHVANCIAAGEVVENPASVAKELCENAIDAGATEITVSMRGGGITELSVADDGCGMTPEDAALAFQRHATSKLFTEADLSGLVTLGFRGEALAAISAVSQVTIETRTADADVGTRLTLDCGKIIERGDAVIMPGTTITVRDLFRNTPARMKFLRTNAAEGSAVASVVGKLALSHPEIRFTFLNDTRTAFTTDGQGDLMETLTAVCGRDFAQNLLKIDAADQEGSGLETRVWGYVTPPQAARASRAMQFFFLNGRSIQNRTILAALEEAYRGFQTTGKFPGCVLHLALDPERVDINVHPNKLTVKFANDNDVFQAVHRAVRAALEHNTARPAFSFTTHPQAAAIPAIPAPRPDGDTKLPDSWGKPVAFVPPPRPTPVITTLPGNQLTAIRTPKPAQPLRIHDVAPQTQDAAFAALGDDAVRTPQPVPEKPQPVQPASDDTPPRVLGVLFGTYIVVEHGDEAIFIDFHAAHERIRYDKLLSEYRAGGVVSQTLLSSLLLPLPPEEYTAVLANTELLQKCGLELDAFGEDTVAIRALPAGVEPDEAPALLRELCESVRADGETERALEMLHCVACHSAVRAGDSLTPAECDALAVHVLSDPDLRFCPHGRPVAVIMKKREFIRNFSRG
ncbi:MAG: DNA mismatch repair endonuclease MutL [Eubacteriales bacterium]|jgi:DNA mismatch repair protein MutL